MSFNYINQQYNTQYKKGQKVKYTGSNRPEILEIVGAENQYLKCKGEKGDVGRYHPAWEIKVN